MIVTGQASSEFVTAEAVARVGALVHFLKRTEPSSTTTIV
uniref:Uncharacterized protein n=1 Tax=Ralstonia solanacearum TaxID=305 RepID=A0A0S4VLF8_RALSL|nr:protein of unknown function [Ralstonia solanacearum]CUV35053.1 protein of unknown function [Ralstonia solanacearum]CUV38495.1 protein of unknown function [Ralstonia solanacearum]CUV59132.1 protein of unknown function [Ralstonia solanacearum]